MANNSIIVKPIGQMVQAMARFGQNLFKPPDNTIRGVEPDTWYSPLQPTTPIGPVGVEPRGFQYWAGQNLLWTPRPDAEYTASDLKVLASYPLARICIENVKDSIIRVPWTIQLKPKPGENKKQLADRAKGNDDLVKINRFFERPDREHDWSEWVRPLLDDMLVIDAAAIVVRKTFSGEIVELPVIRGDSIVRYIDENGFTPMAPQPAYAQLWWGIPLVNLSTDQLIYKPRNIVPRNTVSSQLYGMSPTEQLATEIKIGMQRLQFVLDYYTEGSIPGVVQVVPKGTSPDKIAEAMAWMNSELAGNLAARRQWRMIQGFNEPGKDDQIVFAKEPLLADTFDEMHIRKICYGYGTSPQRLMRMMGTRNASEQQEAAEIEGLIPWLIWLKSVRDHIVQRTFGLAEFESTFDAAREPDPEKQATQVTVLSGKGVTTLNEAREMIGQEPRDEPEADMLGIITPNGFIPINSDDLLEQQKTLGTDADTQHQRTKEVKGGGTDGSTQDDAGSAGAAGKGEGARSPKEGSGRGGDGGDGPEPADARSRTTRDTGKANGAHHVERGGPVTVQKAQPQAHWGFGAVLDQRAEYVVGHVDVLEKDFNEDDHPRDEHGRFADAGGAGEPASGPEARWQDKIDSKFEREDARSITPMLSHVDIEYKTVSTSELVLMHDPGQVNPTLPHEKSTDKWEKAIENGKPMPALVVHQMSNGKYYVHDGNHRGQALRNADVRSARVALMTPHAGYSFTDHGWFGESRHIKLAKFHPHRRSKAQIHPGKLTAASLMAQHSFQHVLHNAFRKLAQITVDEITATLTKVYKAGDDSQDALLRRILAKLSPEWLSLPDQLDDFLESAALSGVMEGAVQVEVTDSGLLAQVNKVAQDWARRRAAELVGMRRLEDGTLIPNPDPKWAITTTTRDDLRRIIANLFGETAPTQSDIYHYVQGAGIYSDSRVTMIARTEIARSQSVGNMEMWKTSGKVQTVDWVMSGDHDHGDECDEYADDSPFDIDEVPDHPAHPNCECVLVANTIDTGEDEEPGGIDIGTIVNQEEEQ